MKTIAMIMVFLALFAGESIWGQDISVRYWNASNSTFSEYPELGTGRVFGDFDTSFFTLRSEFYISSMVRGNMNISYGIINENIMTIDNQATTIRFDGTVWNTKVNAAYALVEDDGSFIDAEVGFYFAKGIKKFYDKTISGTLVTPGNWGEYRITYYGPQVGVHGRQTLFTPIALDAAFVWRPALFNSTSVTGLEDESTDGHGYEYSVALASDIGPTVSLFAGYAYENIYFNPTEISYDLTIEYAGLFFGAGVSF